MEDTLRAEQAVTNRDCCRVLILVLMEDTLRVIEAIQYNVDAQVLILVLMEDTLRVVKLIIVIKMNNSLNPCFNGRYSQRVFQYCTITTLLSLNPCFNGRYSQRRW